MEEKSVVYLTTYSGDLLPKYYIGSTYYNKFLNGYHGSVLSKKWKDIYDQELKDNPQYFKSEIIEICNTRKEALEKELYHQKKNMVVESIEYFNESYAEPNGFFGNRNIAAINAMNNTNVKGKIWVNDGNKSKMVYPDKIPDGYILGRCKHDKNRISKAIIGVRKSWRWVTKINTDESKRVSKELPLPFGYKEGRNRKITNSMIQARMRKYTWYHNPNTEEVKRVYEDEIIPHGFIKGRGKTFSEKIKNSINKNN